MAKKEKKKKEKIRYIDDGRTISDMSGVHDSMGWAKRGTTSSFGDIWKTYWNAVGMMIVPMITVICALGVIYMIIWLVFLLAY